MADLFGQPVLETGAGGGIGGAIAQGFAEAGAEVILSDFDSPGLRSRCEALRGAKHAVSTEIADLVSREGARDLVARCGSTDVLIDAPAVTQIKCGPVIKRHDAFWDKTMSVGLWASVALMQELVPGMVKRGRGNVITCRG